MANRFQQGFASCQAELTLVGIFMRAMHLNETKESIPGLASIGSRPLRPWVGKTKKKENNDI